MVPWPCVRRDVVAAPQPCWFGGVEVDAWQTGDMEQRGDARERSDEHDVGVPQRVAVADDDHKKVSLLPRTREPPTGAHGAHGRKLQGSFLPTVVGSWLPADPASGAR
ncbi:hypothetical protein ZWY2020_012395 [Hordeum vulgare]|nr:hypothetical protein ZWY2020_012395 [Hordeum vulgare]